MRRALLFDNLLFLVRFEDKFFVTDGWVHRNRGKLNRVYVAGEFPDLYLSDQVMFIYPDFS